MKNDFFTYQNKAAVYGWMVRIFSAKATNFQFSITFLNKPSTKP